MSTTYRVLSDQLYRSVALVTTANVVTEAYDTDAYGNTLCYSGPGTDDEWFTDDDIQTNNPINTTIFTGRQYDPESQIYWYRARYYSPQIGRFISRDSLKNAERRIGPNLYSYVSCKAPNFKDPAGLWEMNDFWDPKSPAGNYGGSICTAWIETKRVLTSTKEDSEQPLAATPWAFQTIILGAPIFAVYEQYIKVQITGTNTYWVNYKRQCCLNGAVTMYYSGGTVTEPYSYVKTESNFKYEDVDAPDDDIKEPKRGPGQESSPIPKPTAPLDE